MRKDLRDIFDQIRGTSSNITRMSDDNSVQNNNLNLNVPKSIFEQSQSKLKLIYSV